jgi:hypothetical protein
MMFWLNYRTLILRLSVVSAIVLDCIYLIKNYYYYLLILLDFFACVVPTIIYSHSYSIYTRIFIHWSCLISSLRCPPPQHSSPPVRPSPARARLCATPQRHSICSQYCGGTSRALREAGLWLVSEVYEGSAGLRRSAGGHATYNPQVRIEGIDRARLEGVQLIHFYWDFTWPLVYLILEWFPSFPTLFATQLAPSCAAPPPRTLTSLSSTRSSPIGPISSILSLHSPQRHSILSHYTYKACRNSSFLGSYRRLYSIPLITINLIP